MKLRGISWISRQGNEEDLALFLVFTRSEPEYIMNDQQAVLKAMCERSVLVSTQVAGLVEVISHESVDKI